MAAPIYKGGVPFFKPGVRFANQVWFGVQTAGGGAPVNGSSGTGAGKAGIGSIYVDFLAGTLYVNVGTKASPSWAPISSGSAPAQATVTPLTANGAIPPHTAATYAITKAGVLADTLAAPTAGASGTGDDGIMIRITSFTAFAHTITATGLLNTGSAFVNVATFNANAGATLELMAYQAKWQVMYANGISFS
jgi:hypothetical protein